MIFNPFSKPVFACAVAALTGMGLSPAATLISDNFDSVVDGANINGRTPTVVDPAVGAGTWSAATGNFLGSSGSLSASYANVSAGINLGSFISNNPGVYTLSLTITNASENNSSWIGLGFSPSGFASSNNLVANSGEPWIFYRMNGQVTVYAGPGAVNGTSIVNSTTTPASTVGMPHIFTISLDASTSDWVFNAFVDNVQLDLNGATTGLSYNPATNPNPQYVSISSNSNLATTATATLDNFSLNFTPVPEPSVALLAVTAAACTGFRRRRI